MLRNQKAAVWLVEMESNWISACFYFFSYKQWQAADLNIGRFAGQRFFS